MEEIMNIGSRRETFWDDTMIDTSKTKTEFRLHHMTKRECVATFEGEAGGDDCHYLSTFYDGKKYRMYVNNVASKRYKERTIPRCGTLNYLESDDGLHWEKPDLGIREVNGSKHNNFLMSLEEFPEGKGIDGFRVMLDTNPDCKEGEEYKAMVNTDDKLYVYTSPDAVNFTKKYLVTAPGQYDSINTLIYDNYIKKYRCYYRAYHPSSIPATHAWYRDIRLTESTDLVNWTAPVRINFNDYMDWQLYTNGISRYYRADHIYVGFPARYVERGVNEWLPNHDALKNSEFRKDLFKTANQSRCATAQSDTLFMTSRDGVNWTRYNDAFLTAGPEDGRNWLYGSAYNSNEFIETKSPYEGCDNELSLFVGENRWTGIPGEIYRYSIRLDGFVSQHANWDASWGEPGIVTKPFIFDGKDLFINFSTSAYGGVKIDLRSLKENRSIESAEMFGDATNRKIIWMNGSPAEFAGQPVVMTFHMHDADVYSFKFE